MSGGDRLPRAAQWTAQGTGILNDTNVLPILNVAPVRPDLDKQALIRGLNLCIGWYREARTYSTNKNEKDQERQLVMIYKKAKALNHLLAEDEAWMLLGAPASSIEGFRALIKRIIEAIENKIKEHGTGPGKAYRDSFKTHSPLEWLVGFYLPEVFMLTSIAAPQDLKEYLSSKSAYIRFVQAVLAALRIGVDGQPYASATIIKAAGNRFTGQVRRKQTNSPNDFSFWRTALLRKEMGFPPGPIPTKPQPGFYLLPAGSRAELNSKK